MDGEAESSGAGDAGGDGMPGVPPLPADEVDQAKPGSPYALGYRSGLTASDDEGAGDLSGPADALSGAASALSDKLDSGRQAMRQAAAATTSWFANRATGTQTVTRSPAEGETGQYPPTRPQPVPSTGDAASSSATPKPSSAYSSASSSMTTPSASSASSSATDSPGGSAAGYSSAASSAGRPSGYSNSATPGWHNRVTAAERRPEPPRRGRRQAHLTLARVEPWSVMKFSFVASVVAFIILFVAVSVLYMALAGLGVFSSLQNTVSTITSSQNNPGTNIADWFSASRILGYTGMLGALNIILITALSTIGAVIYNLIANVFGGIEITLRESD